MSLLRRLNGEKNEMVLEPKEFRHSSKNNKLVYPLQFKEIETLLHNYLVEELKRLSVEDGEVEDKVAELSDDFFLSRDDVLNYEEKQVIIQNVIYELTGYGPITPLLKDRK